MGPQALSISGNERVVVVTSGGMQAEQVQLSQSGRRSVRRQYLPGKKFQ